MENENQSIIKFIEPKVLPYKIIKRITKTGEARSGDSIYKRRNARSYRALMQYSTWNYLKTTGDTSILNEYKKGYVVWISPEEYFGDNYPNRSNNLNNDFVVGKTGFVYYSQASELENYPPLETWNELCELVTSSKYKEGESEATWVGDFCLNVKNARPQKISVICQKGNARDGLEELRIMLQDKYHIGEDKLANLPSQCGIGNYDYDYANEETIFNVELQMLYLLLTCEDKEGKKACKYLKENWREFVVQEEDEKFIELVQSDNYDNEFNKFFEKLKCTCDARHLLEFSKLQKINAYDIRTNRPICPLCSKPMSMGEFFEEIMQDEGRQVADNTQTAIVLMHINALRPGKLNHRPYNLGWGHNFCNTVQGNKNIDETINKIREIISSYEANSEDPNK